MTTPRPAQPIRNFTVGPVHEVLDGDEVELSANLDGQRLWFRFPRSFRQPLRGDPFVAAALLPAMRSGTPIVVTPDTPVSPLLLARLDHLQSIFRLWFPWASRIPVIAPSTLPTPKGQGVAALFSGGVDSAFTLNESHREIEQLLFVDRVDTGKHPERASYEQVLPSMREQAAHFGATLVACATNAKEVGHTCGINWDEMMAGAFSGLSMAMGLAELRIPSSATWADLAPSGTHPVTDPLWGTEGLTVVHHGADRRRIEKLDVVLQTPALRDHLRVCMQGGIGNCGRCEKCLRTMAGIRALRADARSLPPLVDLSAVRRLLIRNEAILIDWIEIAQAARSADPELAAAVTRLIRRHRTRSALRALRDALRIRPDRLPQPGP